MNAVTVSDKGGITLPAHARKKLGIKSKSKLEVVIREDEIAFRPIRSIKDVKGIFRGTAVGETKDWETIRNETEVAVAKEVMSEDIW